MKSLLRFTALSFFVLLVALAGCKSVIEINNSTDPEDFNTMVLSPSGGSQIYYDEIYIDVPEDIRNDDYEITDVKIFADAVADTMKQGADLELELYIGLQPGNVNMSNPAINEMIDSAVLTEQGNIIKISVTDSKLIYVALKQERFWMKVVVKYTVADLTVMSVKNAYVSLKIERETGGLLPISYLF